MEIYTFLRMGGTVDRISVLPASESTVKENEKANEAATTATGDTKPEVADDAPERLEQDGHHLVGVLLFKHVLKVRRVDAHIAEHCPRSGAIMEGLRPSVVAPEPPSACEPPTVQATEWLRSQLSGAPPSLMSRKSTVRRTAPLSSSTR